MDSGVGEPGQFPSRLCLHASRTWSYKKRKALPPDGTPSDYLGGQGWYDNAIWAGDPTNADLVIVGGVDLYRSTDGGDQLAEISSWWEPDSAHADQHAIIAHPSYDGVANRTVFFGNDGGVFRADDLADVGTEPQPPFVNGWTELVNDYGVTQFYAGAGHTGSGKIIGGAQDNGSLVFDPALGTEDWREFFGGCEQGPAEEPGHEGATGGHGNRAGHWLVRWTVIAGQGLVSRRWDEALDRSGALGPVFVADNGWGAAGQVEGLKGDPAAQAGAGARQASAKGG